MRVCTVVFECCTFTRPVLSACNTGVVILLRVKFYVGENMDITISTPHVDINILNYVNILEEINVLGKGSRIMTRVEKYYYHGEYNTLNNE